MLFFIFYFNCHLFDVIFLPAFIWSWWGNILSLGFDCC